MFSHSSGSEDPYWDPGSLGIRFNPGGGGSDTGGSLQPPSVIASSRGSKSSDGSKGFYAKILLKCRMLDLVKSKFG